MKYLMSSYNLVAKNNLNSKIRSQVKEGFLLKMTDGHSTGFAVCQVWEELGSHPLRDQLASLKKYLVSNNTSDLLPIISRALFYARMDFDNRKNKIDVFSDKKLPNSYF